MKKDYSEYEYSDYDRYRSRRSNKPSIKLDFFKNAVRFFPDSRQFIIDVDKFYEYYMRQDDLDLNDENEQKRRGITFKPPSEEEIQEHRELTEADEAENQQLMAAMEKKYNVDFETAQIDRDLYYSNHPEHPMEAFINIFSGSQISLNYGEGILDFVYADFKPALLPTLEMHHFFSVLQEEYKEHHNVATDHPPEKVYDKTQEIAEAFFAYESTFISIKNAAYLSLYSAICPPMFEHKWNIKKELIWYGNYLLALQKEYLELIEFCFDEDYFPNALGHLHPAERFCIFKRCRNLPAETLRTETVSFSASMKFGNEMPYGLPTQEVVQRINTPLIQNDDHVALAAKLGVPVDDLLTQIRFPRFMNIKYEFETIEDILELEFTKMLEANVRFRKCKRCGRYFIMKGNYDTNYCDSIAPGETRTCQELAAGENYRAKHADDKGLAIYNKYYKRYAARVKVRQIKEDAFKQWKYQAMTKRDECNAGTITPEEYIQWMENCFPNRKPKQDK